MKALLVLPAFNEAATIKDLVTAAKAQIPNVLVMDDGSFDATADAAGDVMVCRHDRKLGKGEALKTGFKYALEAISGVIQLRPFGSHPGLYQLPFYSKRTS